MHTQKLMLVSLHTCIHTHTRAEKAVHVKHWFVTKRTEDGLSDRTRVDVAVGDGGQKL